jgi:hypothetical protein
MRRIISVCLAVCGMALSSGCNRQDAEALSNIGHILVQKAKALPVSSDAKVLTPNTSEPEKKDEKTEEKNN